ncbi:MAG: radical SAM protein [Candidatus Omnitrophica bacterium]|nr:radical SAM protein [Candidatus Omnitrophota bacterium]
MKIMLINPNSSLIEKSWAYRKFFTPIAPLGLAYMSAVLEKDGFQVFLLDHFATKINDKELLDLIIRERPSLIGFSALTPVMPDITRIAKMIRSQGIEACIAAGNIHPTCFPDDVLKNCGIDIVVRGEGENTILEICRCLRDGGDLARIPGVSFIGTDGKCVHTSDRQLISDLDTLPYPAWHLLDLSKYKEVPLAGIHNTLAFPVLASRGCDYRCYYCSQDKVYKKVRYRNLDCVVEEMEYFNRSMNVRYFGFCDAYFPYNEESGLKFCESMIRRGLHKKLRWCTETRVDKVTPKLLKAMKDAGAHLIMYGIEVGNASILRKISKGAQLGDAITAIKETRKAGILSQGLFILGLPGETVETCRETMRFAKKLDCDFVKFNLAMPYPGSRFFEDYQKTRTVHHHERFTSWFDWTADNQELVYAPEGMDSVTLRLLQRQAMFQYYVRPRIILRHIMKGTINFRNFFFGGIWLMSLFISGVMKKLKKICSPCNQE